MDYIGWIIGTLVLWGLKAITIPFARAMSGKGQATDTPSPGPAPSTEVTRPEVIDQPTPVDGQQPVPVAQKSAADDIPTGYYILADVIVLGVAGLLIGLVTGSYFIGISWKAKDWPGMIVFIIASLIGSAIHG
ncbi:MAG: hypothetical protein ABIG43_00590 [Chloroflexota bacterium]